jgi:signal transduction histidine kinase
MESFRSSVDGGIEATFARIAAGTRIVAAVWMAILGAVTIARDAAGRPGYVVGMIAIGFLWALVATIVAYPDRSLSRGMLALDLGVGVLSLLAPGAAETSASFYGALPLIVVSIAALRGRVEGLVSAGVLVVVVLATIVTDIFSFQEIVGQTTLIFAYVGVGVLVAWIGEVLRHAEARLVEAKDDVAAARASAAREAERADIGRHLHDSVLQTLALIQRDSDDPQKVTIQARRQERELRDWLFGSGSAAAPGFEEGLRAAAADVEERFEVSVDVVVVGDGPPSSLVSGLIAAAGEAMTNAARHGGVSEVDVYGEATEGAFAVYVRDRGVGFDPETVPSDRQGVRSSIVNRLEALGGRADLKSSPGGGTEWRLTISSERTESDAR